MSQNNSSQLGKKIGVKVQEDTDQRLAKFQEMRRSSRKLNVQVPSGKGSEKKEIPMGNTEGSELKVFGPNGNFAIIMALGLTLSLVNDFSDLVFWQKMSLISQTLDITTLLLVLPMIMFASRAYYFSVFIILFVFLLEIMPVIGVVPFWTIGMGVWYFANREK